MKHFIKGLIVTVGFAALLGVGWYYYRDFLTRGMKPTESMIKLNHMQEYGVPIFEMQDIHGNNLSLMDFKDKVVIINFWASWCVPCVREFPSMVRLLEKFPDDLVILALSHDRTFEELENFMKAYGTDQLDNFIILWDKNREVAKDYGTQALPESYILRRDLQLDRKVLGEEQWDSSSAIRYFQQLIEKTESAPPESEG